MSARLIKFKPDLSRTNIIIGLNPIVLYQIINFFRATTLFFLEDESEVTKCFDFVETFWPRMLKVVVEDSVTVGGICQIMGFCETKKVLNDHS